MLIVGATKEDARAFVRYPGDEAEGSRHLKIPDDLWDPMEAYIAAFAEEPMVSTEGNGKFDAVVLTAGAMGRPGMFAVCMMCLASGGWWWEEKGGAYGRKI